MRNSGSSRTGTPEGNYIFQKIRARLLLVAAAFALVVGGIAVPVATAPAAEAATCSNGTNNCTNVMNLPSSSCSVTLSVNGTIITLPRTQGKSFPSGTFLYWKYPVGCHVVYTTPYKLVSGPNTWMSILPGSSLSISVAMN